MRLLMLLVLSCTVGCAAVQESDMLPRYGNWVPRSPEDLTLYYQSDTAPQTISFMSFRILQGPGDPRIVILTVPKNSFQLVAC